MARARLVRALGMKLGERWFESLMEQSLCWISPSPSMFYRMVVCSLWNIGRRTMLQKTVVLHYMQLKYFVSNVVILQCE